MSFAVDLHHAYGGFVLDVNFLAPPGVTALFGRSGAGKTTIAKAISGLLTPDRGRIAIGDHVLLDTAGGIRVPPHRRRIGHVFQDSRLFPHLTVRQNLGFGRWFTAPATRYADTGRIVELLGIGRLLDRRPADLSGGEKQRVAVGRALLASPAALVLDEPLAALDEPRKAEILPYLERLRDELRLPMLYVSHSVPEILRLASSIVVLEAGRVRRAGPLAEVLADPDLFPAFGRHEAGAVLPGRVTAQDRDSALTAVAVSGGEVTVPRVAASPGARVTIRVRARDVMLATARPEGLSALNILPAVVTALGAESAGIVDVQLLCGADRLLARITARSAARLGIAPGLPVFAVFKAVALGRSDVSEDSAEP